MMAVLSKLAAVLTVIGTAVYTAVILRCMWKWHFTSFFGEPPDLKQTVMLILAFAVVSIHFTFGLGAVLAKLWEIAKTSEDEKIATMWMLRLAPLASISVTWLIAWLLS